MSYNLTISGHVDSETAAEMETLIVEKAGELVAALRDAEVPIVGAYFSGSTQSTNLLAEPEESPDDAGETPDEEPAPTG